MPLLPPKEQTTARAKIGCVAEPSAFGGGSGYLSAMDDEARLRQLRIASQHYIYAVSKLPYSGAYDFLHQNFAELVSNDFHIKQKTWLNPYELASIANYIALYGYIGRKRKPFRDIADALNRLKLLWKLAEEEGEYSENPAYEATFTLRWVYQQMPFSIHPLRVARVLSLMHGLLSTPELERYFLNKLGLSGQTLMTVCELLYGRFLKWSRNTQSDLLGIASPDAVRAALELLAATRLTRFVFFNGKVKVDSPVEMPYELNTLLRYPLIEHESGYYAPYPELIGYGATRGFFFRFCEEDGEGFRRPFVRSFEEAVTRILTSMFPKAEILTEQDERSLGWKGKTNDVTVILGDCAILVECKLSGLFVEAKRTASPDAIIADVRKHIADGTNRRGLFQLVDKLEAIRTRVLPDALNEKYKDVKRFFPVLLLFDAVEYANAAETLGNIILEPVMDFARVGGIDLRA